MKLKLTLLIELSVIIIFLISCFTPTVKANYDNSASIEQVSSVEEITEKVYTVEQYVPIIIEEPYNYSGKYPIAEKIWKILKEQGYNDYVCAGILGNIMAEVGGQTLDFSEWEYWSTGPRSGSYGICQWTKGRKENLLKNYGSDIDSQINFLLDNMEYEFNTYGKVYKKGFNFTKFCELKNYKQAALAFAKCYERCGKGSYNVRKRNAEKAYSYFVK